MCLCMLFCVGVCNAQCVAINAYTKQPVQAFETFGPTAGNAYAVSYFAQNNGWPTIVYGPRFNMLGPLEQQFTKVHECAHLQIPTFDETVANSQRCGRCGPQA